MTVNLILQKLSNKVVLSGVILLAFGAGGAYALQDHTPPVKKALQVQDTSATTEQQPTSTEDVQPAQSPDPATTSGPATTSTTTTTQTPEPAADVPSQPAPITLVKSYVCANNNAVYTYQQYSDGSTKLNPGGASQDTLPMCPEDAN
jgi:cytoskeletal protein RodZ